MRDGAVYIALVRGTFDRRVMIEEYRREFERRAAEIEAATHDPERGNPGLLLSSLERWVSDVLDTKCPQWGRL